MADNQLITFALVSSLAQLFSYPQQQRFFKNLGTFIAEAKQANDEELANALFDIGEKLNHDVFSKTSP
jgi:hypothetical protein